MLKYIKNKLTKYFKQPENVIKEPIDMKSIQSKIKVEKHENSHRKYESRFGNIIFVDDELVKILKEVFPYLSKSDTELKNKMKHNTEEAINIFEGLLERLESNVEYKVSESDETKDKNAENLRKRLALKEFILYNIKLFKDFLTFQNLSSNSDKDTQRSYEIYYEISFNTDFFRIYRRDQKTVRDFQYKLNKFMKKLKKEGLKNLKNEGLITSNTSVKTSGKQRKKSKLMEEFHEKQKIKEESKLEKKSKLETLKKFFSCEKRKNFENNTF